MPAYRREGNTKEEDNIEKSDEKMKGILTDDLKKTNINEAGDVRKSTRQRWKKILFFFLVIIFVILLSGLFAFLVLRNEGKNSLRVEDRHILYNGKEYRYRTEIVNILCLGIDKELSLEHMEAGRDNLGMSDAILLVSIDTKKDEATIFSISRDTIAEVQTTTEKGTLGSKQRMQICYQYAYGKSIEQCNKLTVDAVSQLLYNIPIQRYCAVNFQTIPMLNDAIGGVDVVVQEHIEEWGTGFTYGENVHLEGENALLYVRARNRHSSDGATMRAQRQKQYAFAFAQKAKSAFFKDPFLPITMFQDLQESGNMSTNITMEDIVYLMPEMLKVSFADDMLQVLPGESKVGENGFAEFYMDVDTVKELLINTFYEEVDK